MVGDDFEEVHCECGDLAHVIKFYRIEWDYWTEDVEYGAEFLLNHYLPWYKRIVPSLKYLFGYPGVGFDSVILRKSDLQRINDILLPK